MAEKTPAIDPAVARGYIDAAREAGKGGAKRGGARVMDKSGTHDAEEDSQRAAAAMQRVAAFLDNSGEGYIGPIHISEPIRGKVFICKYPTWGEILTAGVTIERELGASDLATAMGVLGEMYAAALGWLPAKDEGAITCVRTNFMNTKRWPDLRPIDWLSTRDPNCSKEVRDLFVGYTKWKDAMTPSDEDFAFYYGTGAAAQPS